MMVEEHQPFVSCVMPTFNRRTFIPNAIRYFLRQDYKNKELLIIDDGTDSIRDLVPERPDISYVRVDRKLSLGAKLNLGCQKAKGGIIANWDDDDWYAPRRIKYQVETLQNKGTQLCGINHLFYYDLRNDNAYQYIYPSEERTWLLGSSLCYTKELWNRNHFADIDVGMDALFVWGTTSEKVSVLTDPTIAVHMIHTNNVSPKKTSGEWWHTYPVEKIQDIIDSDWVYYKSDCLSTEKKSVVVTDTPTVENTTPVTPIKNIYACLVHEKEECVVDLIRNLHYHDPDSTIILYDGSVNSSLFRTRFPYDKFGAILHPKPAPVKHGYLHAYALDCMQFALDNFSFNSFTIVDSDQLAIRSGYTAYIADFFSANSNIGMLSKMPGRITPEKNDIAFWPALQAFKEYDLWKPLLQKFAQGESKFVHWTFWPSTVFSTDAIKDLVKMFKEDTLLQQVMRQSKIWATEEVIFPTLIKLLGYEIYLNPCSYDFVRYRHSYTLSDFSNAINKTDAYWMHPVDRKYDDHLRIKSRQQFAHYLAKKDSEFLTNNSTVNMLTTFSVIDKIKDIEGWLHDKEADLLMAITLKACKESSPPHAIVEIGSYQGKSTVLLGSVVQEYFPQTKVYAIDPHEGNVGAEDQGIHVLAPTLNRFIKNIEDAGLSEVVQLIQNCSFNVKWDKPITMLFIDGLHDYVNVARDFWHFADWVIPRGYVAFHDYSHYYPGVQAFVDELLQTGTYRKVNKAESLMVVQKV